MGLFSKKINKELFELIEADAADNKIGLGINSEYETKIPAPHAITVSEVLNKDTENKGIKLENSGESPIESLKKRMHNMTHPEEENKKSEKTEDVITEKKIEKKPETLLQKCKPYIVDEAGNDATTPKEPLYRLKSVAEILKDDTQSAIDSLSEKYNITVDDLGHSSVADNKIPNIKAEEEKTPEVMIENYQTSLPDISDIDNFVAPKEEKINETEMATIRFTPIKDEVSQKNTVTVSTITNTLDLPNELEDFLVPDTAEEETQLEETEFDSFTVEDEYTSFADSKKLIYRLSLKKRNSFLRIFGTLACSLLIACFELPTLNNLMLSNTGVMMAVCTSIFALSVLINLDMFVSFKSFFSRKSTSDVIAGLASLATLFFSGYCIYAENSGYEIVLLCAITLFFRTVGQFMSRSTMLGNLKQIANQNPKKAISLIMDEATTFAMAKDSIEGDVLVATPRITQNVTDFVKYSEFGKFMNGKMPLITIFSLVLALICGLAAYTLFEGVSSALYSFVAVLCISASPIVFLCDSMPLNSAAKKLNPKGAMIAGKTAAERLELANAVVLSSSDLFPIGTVTLHNMKVLSENPVDDTIVKAASLTEAVNSPLSVIFKQIAGTNDEYSLPDSDTVKYEDKLGISGWVDDELLFIGNRTLMEAHNISVPDVRVDKKILEKGYFPVYIASGNKAMALIVIQYSADPNVVYELRKITDSGVTLLVNNCDPNITAEMISDYLGIYEDSVKIMSNAGVHMYKNAIPPTETCSAPASFKGKTINFISVMNCASGIKKSIALLNVLYVLAFCFGVAIFAYLSFSGSVAPLSAVSIMLYELGALILTLLIYQAFKP